MVADQTDAFRPKAEVGEQSRGFYSELRLRIAALAMNAAPPLGWLEALKGLTNSGKAKQAEVEWTGLNDWLALQAAPANAPARNASSVEATNAATNAATTKAIVTKAQVLRFLSEGGLQVQETVLGGEAPRTWHWREKTPDGHFVLHGPFADARTAAFAAEGCYEWDTDKDAWALVDPAVAVVSREARPPGGPTRYSQWTLPGGRNYRELLLLWPTGGPAQVDAMSDAELRALILRNDHNAEVDDLPRNDLLAMVSTMDLTSADLEKLTGRNAAQYKSAHWDQPNVLAHIRVTDRISPVDGGRVLFVEEIQSDWGQEGKRRGFSGASSAVTVERSKDTDADDDTFDVIGGGRRIGFVHANSDAEALAKASRQFGDSQLTRGLPAAPFVTTTEGWLNLALKRILLLAVGGAYDRVAFISGQQAADLFDLSKRISKVEYEPVDNGNFEISAQDMEGNEVFHEGDEDGVPLSRVEELLGKEIAQKIANGEGPRSHLQGTYREWRTLSGIDLQVGGEGLKAFYDKIVPSTMARLLKKVGKAPSGSPSEGASDARSSDNQLQSGLSTALSTVRIGGATDEQREAIALSTYDSSFEDLSDRAQKTVMHVAQEQAKTSSTPQMGFEVTQALRDRLSVGLPLFSRSAQPASQPASAIGVGIESLRQLATSVSARLPNAPPIVVLPSPASAPPELLEHIEREGAFADAEGVLFGASIYLFAANIESMERAEFVLAEHEIAHAGFQVLLGDTKEATMLQLAALNPDLQARATAKALRQPGLTVATAVEEVLADTPSSALPRLHGWDRFLSTLALGLAQIGLQRAAGALLIARDKVASARRQEGQTAAQLANTLAADLLRAARAHAAGDTRAAALAFITRRRLAALSERSGSARVAPGFRSGATLGATLGAPLRSSWSAAFSRTEQSRWTSLLKLKIGELGMKAAPASSWLDAIRGLTSKGVKPEEIDWSGLVPWIQAQEGSISKPAILAYLDAHGTKVQEVILGLRSSAARLGIARAQEVLKKERFEIEFNAYGDPATIVNAVNRIEYVFDTEAGEFTDYEGDPIPYEHVRLAANQIAALQAGLDAEADSPLAPKYENYTLPGGENYREVLLTLADRPATDAEALAVVGPEMWDRMTAEQRAEFKSYPSDAAKRGAFKTSHWIQANVLVHLRVNDRVSATGERVLFVEEIQSDWGQNAAKRELTGESAGMRRGLKGDPLVFEVRPSSIPDHWDVFDTRTGKAQYGFPHGSVDRARQAADQANTVLESLRPPAAPFVRTTEAWLSLALKRIVAMAVEGGYDQVAFINGQQAAARFGLAKPVNRLAITRTLQGHYHLVGTNHTPSHESSHGSSHEWPRPAQSVINDVFRLDQLPGLLGKDLARQAASKADAAFFAEPLSSLPPGYRISIDRHTAPDQPFTMVPEEQIHGRPLAGRHATEQEAVDAAVQYLEQVRTKTALLDVENIRLGGMGLTSFYDDVVPAALKRLLRKLGGPDVSPIALPPTTPSTPDSKSGFKSDLEQVPQQIAQRTQLAFAVTSELRSKVIEGLPLFSRRDDASDDGRCAGDWHIGAGRDEALEAERGLNPTPYMPERP